MTNEMDVAASLNNIGNVYASIKENQKSIKYFNEALKIIHRNKEETRLKADIYNNLGASYKDIGVRALSEKFHKKAYLLRKKLNDKLGEAVSLMNIANSVNYSSDSILIMYNSALSIFKTYNYFQGIATAYNNVGNYYRFKENYDSAMHYYQLAEKLCDEQGLLEIKGNVIRDIGYVHLMKKDLPNYEYYLLKYEQLRDSIFSKQNSRIVSELEAKYHTAEKQLQIEVLENEREKQKSRLYKARLYWAIATLSLLTVIFAGVLLFYRYRQKQKYKGQQFEKQKLEFQNKVLRLQMNPHFIFNSLNSIQSYIAQNNALLAEEYLAKFAQLMRKILINSTQEYISLNEDIETLETYLELEKSRFLEKFDYQIEVDQELDEEFILIPPMIAQPFVENSIIHGFSEINYKGLIKIQLKPFDERYIKCTIEDNGIGRARAIFKQKDTRSKSMGITLTQERLADDRKTNAFLEKMKYTDVTDGKGNVCGTKVELLIRYKMD
jgi:tetratricopeptide (TPR) repeat protein